MNGMPDEEAAMRRIYTEDVRAWVRSDLATRYGEVLKEDLPQEMLDLLRMPSRQV